MNSIREGVLAKLAESFPAIAILEQMPEQPPAPPYMAAQLKLVTQTQQLGASVIRSHQFDVQYAVPEGVNAISELHEAAEQLYEVFGLVSIEDKAYRGMGMQHEVKDGRLHFSAELHCRLNRQSQPQPKMGAMEGVTGIR
ncbi:phage tail terminator family protein [Paenibacillus chungangensis]|uniref:DUF6838 family protein n=1 Tax=Paenibacillus chungangensis TaxID=696535 RepID=A0ABW3HQJ4_9BACL